MAIETTLIGWFVVPHVNELLKKAYYVLSEDTMRKLATLQIVTLPRLEAMIQNEEEMGDDSNRLLAQLIKEFEEVSYEIEDVVDKVEYELLRQHSMGKMRKAVSFPIDAASSFFSKWNMTNVLKDLDDTVSSINNFYPSRLPSNNADAAATRTAAAASTTTTTLSASRLPAEQVLERDTDIEKIKGYLTTASMPNKFVVVAIIGVGGVGKTELANRIYDRGCKTEFDEEDINFEPKIWITCPRRNFDEVGMTRSMVDQLTNRYPDGAINGVNLRVLRNDLRQGVSGKKFLLVLDDVWYDEKLTLLENHDRWRRFCDPLNTCEQGSMILITTRMEIVAKSFNGVSGATKKAFLKGLEHQNCLAIFNRHAFGEGGPDEKANDANLPTLASEIVTEIIHKMDGLPLAAREAGQMLNNERDPQVWDRTKSNIIQEATRKSLMQSYQMLSQQLQQCIVHLSLYPRGFKFNPTFLALSWIAAGVITHKEGNESKLEDVGRECFHALVTRSFFQPTGQDGLFVLHSALHAVADIITMKECMRIEGHRKRDIPLTIKHLSIEANNLARYKKQISKLKKLRTLFIICSGHGENSSIVDHDVLEVILKKTKRLRALRLASCSINKLPDSIGRSKHLRFLDLSNSRVCNLPESVCRVYHLWYLDLNNCNLTTVPKDLNKLIKLQYLVSDGTTLSKIPHIGRLTLLRELKEFHVKKEKGHDLGQLKDMDYLQGALRILNLEAVGDANEADGAMLKRKIELKEFVSEWSSERAVVPHNKNKSPDKKQPATKPDDVFDKLQPHDQIRNLTVRGYAGDRTPTWMKKRNPDLGTLELHNCPNWGTLPALGSVYTNLKQLVLSGCPKLVSIPSENGHQPLPSSLRRLHLHDSSIKVSTLENWLKNLDSLSCLELSKCSNLIPPDGEGTGLQDNAALAAVATLLPESLVKLRITDCPISNSLLSRCLMGLNKLTHLELHKCACVTTLPPEEVLTHLVSLQSVSVHNCDNLMSVGGLQVLAPPPPEASRPLRKLSIQACRRLQQPLPPNLQSLMQAD